MTAKIEGVIVEFNSTKQQGTVLLRHRDAPSLDFVIDEYLDGDSDYSARRPRTSASII
jgi:hypothetical protein